jgi:hypothetical protein
MIPYPNNHLYITRLHHMLAPNNDLAIIAFRAPKDDHHRFFDRNSRGGASSIAAL